MDQLIPKHVGIIPDGNRRWAKEKGLSTFKGHLRGYEAFIPALERAFDRGVKVVTIWGFSTDNWKRDDKEVDYLMDIFRRAIKETFSRLDKRGIRILVSGRIDELPDDLAKSIYDVMEKTKNHENGTLNFALNYGGRAEILDAVKKMLRDDVDPEKVNEEVFNGYLYQPELPDFDIVMRTSGEKRTSGFFPWQGAYTEFIFIDKHWPDFTPEDFDALLEEYANRNRRFGGN